MKLYLEAIVAENPDKFEVSAQPSADWVFSREDWKTLCQMCSPGMHNATMNSLFTTMDKNNDSYVSSKELFSDTILGILQRRFNHTSSVHPLEGAYMCLPNPPFEKSQAQDACIQLLVQVWNEVVADWQANGSAPKALTMVPDLAATPKATPVPKETVSGWRSFLSSVKASPAKKPEVHMKAKPQAPKGLYLVGGSGCGKTILMDMFYRSLPANFPVVRVHWHEFQRDVFRLTGRSKAHANENLFDSAALAIAPKCKVLLLDEVWITHINEALNVKELCRALWARGVTIIFTSNYRQSELYHEGFNRAAFADFLPDLAEQCPEFDFREYACHADYRLTDLENSNGNYVHPINDETTAQLKAMQNSVLGPGAQVEENFVFEIPGEGRSKVLPLSAIASDGSKLCEVDFRELFSKPLGRAIYSALAIEYDHIFITGAPKFKLAEQSAEFRRFVTFSDIVYGKKGSLYIQAECEATEIFEDPKGGSEEVGGAVEDDYRAWVRMKSMLGEMRTSKYSIISWLARNHMTKAAASKLVL